MNLISRNFKKIKQFINHSLIENRAKKLGLKLTKITINEDNSIDYQGNVLINDYNLEEIPIKFGTVYGDFICESNRLKTLKNSPHTITADFYCSENKLTSLEFGPINVGGHYYCKNNKLKSLEFSPKVINGIFDCSYNELTNLKYCPENIQSGFNVTSNQIDNLDYFPQFVGGAAHIDFNEVQDIETLKRCEIVDGLYIGGRQGHISIEIAKFADTKKKFYSNSDLEQKFKKDEIMALKESLEQNLDNSEVSGKRKLKI